MIVKIIIDENEFVLQSSVSELQTLINIERAILALDLQDTFITEAFSYNSELHVVILPGCAHLPDLIVSINACNNTVVETELQKKVPKSLTEKIKLALSKKDIKKSFLSKLVTLLFTKYVAPYVVEPTLDLFNIFFVYGKQEIETNRDWLYLLGYGNKHTALIFLSVDKYFEFQEDGDSGFEDVIYCVYCFDYYDVLRLSREDVMLVLL